VSVFRPPLRQRKFIGAIALFVLVVVWALVAKPLAQMPAIRDNAITSFAYYVIAGLELLCARHSDRHVDVENRSRQSVTSNLFVRPA
jgi:hypothetical protein